ncbi:MAG: DNA-directed RNA polymerase subunit omega [Akkermansia sp.]|nr:DNA-directed RNA polymerase subunit omega [Akkermansia sp.]
MNVELIEKAVEIVGDNQLLVNIVSKRVQQLNHGSDPYVVTTPEMQCGDIALTEIIEGKIQWHEMTEEELAAAQEVSVEDPFADLAKEAAAAPAVDEPVLTVTPDL